MFKSKALEYANMLKQHIGAEDEALDRFNNLIENALEREVLITINKNEVGVYLLNDEDVYLNIYSDNTVACSEDEYGKFMHFQENIFDRAMVI